MLLCVITVQHHIKAELGSMQRMQCDEIRKVKFKFSVCNNWPTPAVLVYPWPHTVKVNYCTQALFSVCVYVPTLAMVSWRLQSSECTCTLGTHYHSVAMNRKTRQLDIVVTHAGTHEHGPISNTSWYATHIIMQASATLDALQIHAWSSNRLVYRGTAGYYRQETVRDRHNMLLRSTAHSATYALTPPGILYILCIVFSPVMLAITITRQYDSINVKSWLLSVKQLQTAHMHSVIIL